MITHKFVTYTSIDTNGNLLLDEYELNLNISPNFGNYLIHRVIVRQQFLKNTSTAATKTRAEVRGGGCKPWKQKGTGRARAGSNRSPLWRGGGVCFGPKFKTQKFKLNKKERKLAFQTLLFNKRNDITILDGLSNYTTSFKTKNFLKICANCNINLNQKILLIIFEKTPFLEYSTQNIKNLKLMLSSNLNIIHLLKVEQIIITPAALKNIQEVYCD